MADNLRVVARYGQPVLPLFARAHYVTCGGPGPKLVYLVMHHLARTSGQCWASVATIARCAESGVTTVRRHLRALELGGRIEPEGGTSRGRRTTFYRMVDVEPGQIDRVEPGQIDRVEPGQIDRVEPGQIDRVSTPYGVTEGARDPRGAPTEHERAAVREAARRAELAKPRPFRKKVGASRPVSNGRRGAGLTDEQQRCLQSINAKSREYNAETEHLLAKASADRRKLLAKASADRRKLSQLRHNESEG